MADALAQWLDEMEARAEKATPGQIDVVRRGPLTSTCIGTQPLADYYRGRDKGDDQPELDAQHQAAWSPDVARAVLAVVRAARDGYRWADGDLATNRTAKALDASLVALRRIVEGA